MGMLDGKVAFISGAARGQGRSHALWFADEGADIVAIDLCDQIDSVPYPLSTTADLEKTAKAVEGLEHKVVARVADVRDISQLQSAVAEATTALGPIDIVVANAGIAAMGSKADPDTVFRQIVDVNLVGVWNTVIAAAPSMQEAGKGGAIVLISSTQGLKGTGGDGSAAHSAHSATKHGVRRLDALIRTLAGQGFYSRQHCAHPTGVETPMILNDAIGGAMAANPHLAAMAVNLPPVSMLQPADVGDAVLWLASDHAKYVTGVILPVDAGFNAR